ncbi:MAG: hypothetical protein CVU11_04340 [Bacteroidetes bacterium HGW-Bacteroidetes-6]|jgi:hypothetical protein|nr:MAG: hypothetical protein CVU11_04340 [Bacteroidetes bacterium HGW-Bacteroidetes-6]
MPGNFQNNVNYCKFYFIFADINHAIMKTVLSIFLSAISFVGISQNLTDSLLLYYPMNGNCLDSSGNGFDAVVVNADLTTDHNGNANKAYHFNGIDQYIDWPNDTLLHPDLPVTIAFWVKYDVNDYLMSFLFDTDYAENNYSGIHVNLDPGMRISFAFGDASGSTAPSARRSKTGTTVIQTGIWYHIIGVIRGATDMDIYVDCINDGGTYSGTGGNMEYTGSPGSLGRVDTDVNPGPPHYFEGSLDDFRYYNRDFSSSDIEKLCPFNSIFETSIDKINSYPNPTMDYLSLDNIDDDVKQIDIVDIFGNIVMSYSIETSLNVSGLQPGIFFLRLIDANGSIKATSTFVKL